jgi:formylglycine-generating enzyme required for sulfatase activity
MTAVGRELPALDDCVRLPAGRYVLGDAGAERPVALAGAAIGRWPVVCAQIQTWVDATGRPVGGALAAKLAAAQLADHPATDLTRADAEAFCAWASERLGRRVRLPYGDEWEALARGMDRRPWPWGDVFDEQRCACAESGWGWTVAVGAHPAGAGPFGAEQQAGNVWEWVADTTADGWGVVRGGCYLDTGWGLRSARALPADPGRATATTGFRIAIEEGAMHDG